MTVAGTLPIDSEVMRTNERAPHRAMAMVAGASVVPLVVVLVLGLWFLAPVVVLLAVGAVLGGPELGARRTLDALGAQPVDEDDEPRFHNVLDGLCVAHGLSRPELYVVVDAACNAVATGRGPRRSVLVVTSGLLEALTPIELEGVMAHELLRIERRDTVVPVTAAWFPPARSWGAADDQLGLDRAAVELTRYPPGLAGALEKAQRNGSDVARPGATTAAAWLVPHSTATTAGASLDERIAALREL